MTVAQYLEKYLEEHPEINKRFKDARSEGYDKVYHTSRRNREKICMGMCDRQRTLDKATAELEEMLARCLDDKNTTPDIQFMYMKNITREEAIPALAEAIMNNRIESEIIYGMRAAYEDKEKEFILLLCIAVICSIVIIGVIVVWYCSTPVSSHIYVDEETGVNYIRINDDDWIPRYDSNGEIMVTKTTTEET